MKSVIKRKFSIFILLVNFMVFFADSSYLHINILNICVNTYAAEEIRANDLYAKSAILIDADSKRVLYEKNGYEKMAMASTTKIMTCLIALENSKEEDIVEFSTKACSMPKVKLGAVNGRKFRMHDMLYSLMLESHNVTAVAIAEAVAGSTENFAVLMNKRAREIGAVNTNFVTPNGLDDELHYTTAYDMAIIAAEAIKNEKFLEIVNTCSHSFSDIEGKCSYSVYNKDAFLEMIEGAIGIKTGFTGNAGYCFVGAVRRNNKTFISVVLASGWPPSKTYKWKDTVKLMNYGFDNYEYRVLFSGIDLYKNILVENGIEDNVNTYISGECQALVSDKDVIEYVYDDISEKKICAPVREGQILGYMRIMINKKEFAKYKICASKNVKKIDIRYSFMVVFKRLLF